MDDQNKPDAVSETIVLRQAIEEAAPPPPPGPFSSPVKVLTWTLTLGVAIVGLGGIGALTVERLQSDLLLRASEGEVRERLGDVWPSDGSGAYYETLGEYVGVLEPEDRAMAKLAAERAVEADPDRAFAWARIAYLSTDPAAAPGEETVNALRASMEHCSLCDPELVRWRFNFVLAHWDSMPEDVRTQAFTHADMLRWSGANAEFLAEMRVKSRAVGIPYDAYRADVDTPVRSLDILPPEPVLEAPAVEVSAEG